MEIGSEVVIKNRDQKVAKFIHILLHKRWVTFAKTGKGPTACSMNYNMCVSLLKSLKPNQFDCRTDELFFFGMKVIVSDTLEDSLVEVT